MTEPRAPVASTIIEANRPARHFARWMLQVSDAIAALTEPRARFWALLDLRTAAGGTAEVDAVTLRAAPLAATLPLTAAVPMPGVMTLTLETAATVRLLGLTAGLAGPASFTLARSSDGTIWHPTHRVIDPAPWAAGETRAYTLTPAA